MDHDRGCVVWCARGHDKATLSSFFESLTDAQRAGIEVVTRDGAGWIADVVSEFCPGAEQVMDPFHAVQWVTDALDGVRRACWREARVAAEEGGGQAGARGQEEGRRREGQRVRGAQEPRGPD